MKKVVAMTIHDRGPEVIRAVFAGLAMPGNRPDYVAICFDRASTTTIKCVDYYRRLCDLAARSCVLDDDAVGPRCPSKAWNAVFSLIEEDHAFCVSSDVVLAPHTVGMAYHLAEAAPKAVIVGRAEHCGQSYTFHHDKVDHERITDRVMTASWAPSPLGFLWLLPMATAREIGGYDESYMDGLCYEDTDFVARMWHAGADFAFCDDMVGFHLEHSRAHLKDADGRVSRNAKRFAATYGDLDYIRCMRFGMRSCKLGAGMSLWAHEEDQNLANNLERQQRTYDLANQAVPPEM